MNRRIPRFFLDSLVVHDKTLEVNFIPSLGLQNISLDRAYLEVFVEASEEGLYPQALPHRAPHGAYFYVIPLRSKRLVFPNLYSIKFNDDVLFYQYDKRSLYIEENILKEYFLMVSDNRIWIESVFNESITEYSHEFRNILKQAIDKVGLILDKYQISGSISDLSSIQDLDYILNLAAMRLEYYNLVYSNEEAIDHIYLDLKNEINNVSKSLEIARRRKRISVFNEYAYGHKILTSPLISIVFYIILDNAIQYSDEDEEIRIISSEKKEYIEVVFINVGLVIDENQDVFLKGKRSRSGLATMRQPKGTGIGLSVARQFCTALGGDIKFEQDKKQGSPPRTALTKVSVLIPKNI